MIPLIVDSFHIPLYQRQYEVLRAIFVDSRSQKEVAEEFGFQYRSVRQLVYEFRRHCDAGPDSSESPFFGTSADNGASKPSTRNPSPS